MQECIEKCKNLNENFMSNKNNIFVINENYKAY